MDKKKETVAKILELLDGIINLHDKDSRERLVEKLLDVLTEEISARQSAVLLKICGSSSQVESLADSILEKVQRGSSQATL